MVKWNFLLILIFVFFVFILFLIVYKNVGFRLEFYGCKEGIYFDLFDCFDCNFFN